MRPRTTKTTSSKAAPKKAAPKKKPTADEAFQARVGQIFEASDLKALKALVAEEGAASKIEGWLVAYAFRSEIIGDETPRPSVEVRKEFAEALLDMGVDLNAKNHNWGTPLARVVSSSGLWEGAERLRLVKKLLDLGADPNVAAGWRSALDLARDEPEMLALMSAKTNAEGLLGMLMSALYDISNGGGRSKEHRDAAFARVKEALGSLRDIDLAVPYEDSHGLAPIHQAAIHGDRETIELLLRKAKQPGLAVSESGTIAVWMGKPGHGFVPETSYSAGMTAIDLIDPIVALLEAAQARYAGRKDDRYQEARPVMIARLQDNRAALVAAGVSSRGRPAAKKRAAKKPYKANLDRSFSTLAEIAGVSTKAVQDALDRIDTTDIGPWSYFEEAIQAVPELMTDVLEKKLEDSHLRRFLKRDPFDGDDPMGVPLHVEHYPKEAQRGLKEGVIVGATDASILFLWPSKTGAPVARVCLAHPESFLILGKSVEDFVAKEVEKLRSSPARPRGGKRR